MRNYVLRFSAFMKNHTTKEPAPALPSGMTVNATALPPKEALRTESRQVLMMISILPLHD